MTEEKRKAVLARYRLTDKYKVKQERYLESEKGVDYLSKKRQRHRRRRLNKETSGTLTAYEYRVIVHAYRKKCAYCGKITRTNVSDHDPDLRTIDHVIPLSKGGEHSRTNVVPACRACNDLKGDQDGWVPQPPIGKLKF